MCNYKILAHNDNGYLIQCCKCQSFQLAFGTTVVSFSADEYAGFKYEMYEQKKVYKYDGFLQQKTIHLPLFVVNAAMVVNYNELLKLVELIEQAELMMEVNEIIFPAMESGKRDI